MGARATETTTEARRAGLHPVTLALAALLLWLPLPFASVAPWAHSVLQVAAFLIAALALLLRPAGPAPRSWLVPFVALVAVAAIGLLQSIALPEGVIRALSPERVRLAQTALASGAAATTRSLSLSPEATADAALTFAAMAALFLAAVRVGGRRRDRRLIVLAIAASALFQVFFGAVAPRGADTIWGVAVPAGGTRLRGSFVNPDHLAVYLEIALALVFAWLIVALRLQRETDKVERKYALVAAPSLVWLTLFVGLAFTGSRGGLVAGVCAVAVQGALFGLRASRRPLLATSGVVAAIAGIGAVAFFGLQKGLGRWMATSQYELTWNSRLLVYQDAIDMAGRFPAGTGLATFREAFPLVRSDPSLSSGYWHGHNDYLEMLATGGVAALVVMLVALVVLVAGLLRVLREGERTEIRMAGLGALGALAGVALHSGVDFGLSMPANAATLVIVCGVALAAGLRVEGPTHESARRLRHELGQPEDAG